MSRLHLRRPSPGLVLAVVALFVALGGGAYAATSSDTKADKKIAKKAAKSYFNGHIGGASVSHASTAGSATNADKATNATNATNATTASNADKLGGLPPSSYQTLWALVQGDGTLVRGSGTVGTSFHGASTGVYDVVFNHDVSGCSAVVTPWSSPEFTWAEIPSPQGLNKVRVVEKSAFAPATAEDAEFNVAVFC